MPLPIIPIVTTAAKVLAGGAVFGAGNDLYKKGRALVAEHGPQVKAGLAGFAEDISAFAGFGDDIHATDILDPLDLFGERERRENEAMAALSEKERAAAKKKLVKQKKEYLRKLAKQKRISEARAKAMQAERMRDRQEAESRLSAMKAEAERVLANAKQAGASALQSAKATISRINALRMAEKHAVREEQREPGSTIADIVSQVYAAVAAGGQLPDPSVYAAGGALLEADEPAPGEPPIEALEDLSLL